MPANDLPALSRSAAIVLDTDAPLRLMDVHAVAATGAPLVLGPALRARAAAAEACLDRHVAARRRIYGVTTGYGPLATSYIAPERAAELQRYLVCHLATGVGAPLPPDQARAVAVARLAALAAGRSGVRAEVLDALLGTLNAGLAPAIPEKGTVGASGDLTPLSHLALALMGEGAFLVEGAERPAAEVLAAHGLAPIVLGRKDALALVNGTSAMTGIAALAGVRARWLLDTALATTVTMAELLGGRTEAWHKLIAAARPHPGQIYVQERLWALAADSDRLVPPEQPPPVLDDLGEEGVAQSRPLPQDAYSLRCAPQLLGAIADTLDWHERVVATELNAATDNPLVFAERDFVMHAGNFFGQHVGFASDALTNAVVMLAVHSERKVARLTDPVRSGGFPPFLQPRETGLMSGFMGAQVTASALVGEMRARAHPASIQSISTNGDNQDINPMGTIAARKSAELVEDAARVIAIEALAATQGFELAGGFTSNGAGFSACARRLAERVRALSDFVGADRPLAPDIARVAAAVRAGELAQSLP